MATKQGLERLLKKGTLTGREAARLILQDSVEVDHGREGFLSAKEIRQITNSLSPAEGREYNRWIDVYRTLAYFIKDGEIIAWSVAYKLEQANLFIHQYVLDRRAKVIKQYMPRIVTEKQYQDLKERQQKSILESYRCLDQVFSDRAYDMAPEEIQARYRGDNNLIAFVKDYPELYQEAERQIMELVEAGRLTLVELEHKASDKDRPSFIEPVYTEAKTSEEEERRYLQTYISTKELYEAGFPEVVEWVEVFKPGLLEEDEADSYAVIQPESHFYTVDEQGYYKDPDWLSRLSWLQEIDEGFKEEDGKGLEDFLKQTHASAKSHIQRFLAGKSVVDTVSEILGVNFGEDLEARYEHLIACIESYNAFLGMASPVRTPDLYKGPQIKLHRIHLERLKPSARELKTLREQLASSLGEEWWLETANTWLKERQALQNAEPEELEDEEEEVASGQE